MPHVYGDIHSGNCYKVKLLLTQLGIAHTWEHVDILAGATHTPEFLAMNPEGRIPLVRLDDGRLLAESNAILNYYAEGSPLLPADRYLRALVLQWQFFEQYSHEPYIATPRYIVRYLGNPPARQAELAERRPRGYAALNVMEHHLAGADFFVGGHYTIADISLYAYTHVAPEGGIALDDFPRIRAWLARIAAQPGHLPMPP
ncbi:MAG: glutathione S-transferase family protein [Gammaproteobacteria bacterium]|nr:glutathione S-transferase family protein [Gammaproteobacteria bacterium]